MAFRVGGQFEHRLISRTHLVAEGALWGVPDADDIVDDTLATVVRIATDERPHPGAHHGMQHDVLRFTGNLIAGRAAGDGGDGLFDLEPTGPSPRNSTGGWAMPLPASAPARSPDRGLGATPAGGNSTTLG